MWRQASWLTACWSSALLWAAGAGAACQTPARAPVHEQGPAEHTWTEVHTARGQAALRAYGLALRPNATRIVVHDTTASFVAATGHDEPALRAWTTWSTVHLLHPRRWNEDSDVARAQRITHELCHAALLHAFADERSAIAARVPRFFTEGACSVIAMQRRLPLTDVITGAQGALPLTIEWFTDDPDVAYGASHALALWLVRQHGPGVFAQVVAVAAQDGRAGCVERALLTLTAAPDVPALWQRMVDSQGSAP